jgi:L-iditol 2-dehydrogenase
VDVQKQSADLVFGGKIPLHLLISHRMPLENIQKAFELATRPTADSLKIVVNPNG